jgi:hypothetical protein
LGLELNGTTQPLAYAGDRNLLRDNIVTTNKNTETLIDVTRKCVAVQVFGNDINKSKFDSEGNQEEIEFR